MSKDPTFGLVVIEDRLDERTDTGTGYSETGAGPGQPVVGFSDSEWTPYAVAAQTRAIEMRVLRPGYPGRDGATVAWRLATDSADTDWRGWDDPITIQNVSTPDDTAFPGSGSSWLHFGLARNPRTEEVVVLAVESGAAGQPAQQWSYVPSTQQWSSVAIDFATAFDGMGGPVALAWDDEKQRMVLWYGPGTGTLTRYASVALQSTDEYATSYRIMSTRWGPDESWSIGFTFSACRITVGTAVGRDWLMMAQRSATTSAQLRSSDRGATWVEVDSSVTDGDLHRCASLPEGGYVVGYINASSRPCVKVLTSAASLFDDADEVVCSDAITVEQLEIAVDADGIVYLVVRDAASNHDSVLWVLRSLDGGGTWSTYENRLTAGNEASGSVGFDLVGLTAAGGQLHLLVNGGTAGWSLWQLGGWTTVEMGEYFSATSVTQRLTRCGYGSRNGAADPPGRFFSGLNGSSPAQLGWSAGGAGGSVAITERGYHVTTSSAIHDWDSPTAANSRVFGVMAAIIDLEAGGAIGSGTVHVGLRLRAVNDAGSPTSGVEVEIRVYTDGIDVFDTIDSSSVGSVSSLSLTDEPVHIRASINGADDTVSVWYRLEGDDEPWIAVVVDAALNDTVGVTTDVCSWGVLNASTATVNFRMVGLSEGWFRTDLVAATELTDSTGTPYLEYGKPLPSVPYPVSGLVAAAQATDAGQVIARGLARAQDTASLPVRYRYALANAWPSSSPSPRKGWRQGSTAGVTITWEWAGLLGTGDGMTIGDVAALVVIGAGCRTWDLQELNAGTASYDTIATLDLALGSGLTFAVTGSRIIRPASGTVPIDRYIHEGELVGGWFESFSGGRVTTISANSAGYWSDAAGLQQVTIELAADDAHADGSDGVLCAPSGLVVGVTGQLAPTRHRVRIAGSQPSPYGEYRAGVIAIGRVVGIGADPSWSYRHVSELTREVTRRTDEVMDVRVRGPRRRTMTYDWSDGVVVRELQHLSSGDVSSVAYSGSPPIGTKEDAHTTLTELVVGRMQQGRVPTVVVPRLPPLGVTLTDPTQWLYGRVRSDTHGATGVAGTEGLDAVVRVDSLTIEEIP